MVGEEILLEIDSTLDQLIQNAEAIENVEIHELNQTEIDAFQKTQESLLHHLIYMDEFLLKKKNSLKLKHQKLASFKIQEKMRRFEKMKSSYSKNLSKAKPTVAFFTKRRAKRLLTNNLNYVNTERGF